MRSFIVASFDKNTLELSLASTFPKSVTPTQSGESGYGGISWFGMRSRARSVHCGSGYPPCGRQSDVTDTFSAPVTSPHSQSGDVMTSPDRVCAGNDGRRAEAYT